MLKKPTWWWWMIMLNNIPLYTVSENNRSPPLVSRLSSLYALYCIWHYVPVATLPYNPSVIYFFFTFVYASLTQFHPLDPEHFSQKTYLYPKSEPFLHDGILKKRKNMYGDEQYYPLHGRSPLYSWLSLCMFILTLEPYTLCTPSMLLCTCVSYSCEGILLKVDNVASNQDWPSWWNYTSVDFIEEILWTDKEILWTYDSPCHFVLCVGFWCAIRERLCFPIWIFLNVKHLNS